MKNNKKRLFEIMTKINSDFHSKNPEFIITVGISGSGKSTWIKSFKKKGYTIISPDEIRKELTGNISDQSRNSDVFSTAYQRAINALNAGESVIFDATNIISYSRKQMLYFIRKNVEREFNALAKVFNVDPEIAKERIQGDIEAGVDRSNVSPERVDKQFKDFTKDLNKIESDGYKIID